MIDHDALTIARRGSRRRRHAPTLQFDFSVVTEMTGTVQSFRGVDCDVLLLGGSKSLSYLKAALDALESVLPRAHRLEFPGLNHGAAWNEDRSGRPQPIAAELRRFFA